MMARQNLHTPVLTIERCVLSLWMSLGLREANARRLGWSTSDLEGYPAVTVQGLSDLSRGELSLETAIHSAAAFVGPMPKENRCWASSLC